MTSKHLNFLSHLAFPFHMCHLLCTELNRRLPQQAWTPLPKEQAGISAWNASLVGFDHITLGWVSILHNFTSFYYISLNLRRQLSVSHQAGSAVRTVGSPDVSGV